MSPLKLSQLNIALVWKLHQTGLAASSLAELSIQHCPKLTSLPEEMRSLRHLRALLIFNCPDLSEICQKETGKDWPNISHIPEIRIFQPWWSLPCLFKRTQSNFWLLHFLLFTLLFFICWHFTSSIKCLAYYISYKLFTNMSCYLVSAFDMFGNILAWLFYCCGKVLRKG